MTTSIFLATPMFGGKASAHYIHSVLLLQQQCYLRNIPLAWEFITNESLITRARNVLAHKFLQSNCDFFMSIDADIAFQPNDVFALLDMQQDIACGLYPFKTIDWQRVKDQIVSGKDLSAIMADSSPAVCNWVPGKSANHGDKIVEIVEGGTGFMCVNRRVFEAMQKTVAHYYGNAIGGSRDLFYEYFSTSIDPHRQILLSEDYHFCWIWRQLGGKIYANLNINLSHVGEYVYQNQNKYLPMSTDSKSYFSTV